MKSARAGDWFFFTAVVIFCACGGCAPGPTPRPESPPGPRANLRGRNPFSLVEGATIVAIDGQTLVFANSVDLAPGPHVARVCLEGALSSYLRCEDLRFVAEGGRSYVARGTSSGVLNARSHLWIEDARTGRAVAGQKP